MSKTHTTKGILPRWKNSWLQGAMALCLTLSSAPQAQVLPSLLPINPDPSFIVDSMLVTTQGRFWVGGRFLSIGGGQRPFLARIKNDGSLDTPNLGLTDWVSTIKSHDQHIYVGGAFTEVDGQTRHFIFRMNVHGVVDTSFQPLSGVTPNPTPTHGVTDLLIQPNGKIVIVGRLLPDDDPATPSTHAYIARLNPDGTLDSRFAPDLDWGYPFYANSIARQSDGKLLVGGRFTTANGAPGNHLIRLHPDGSFDDSFQNPSLGGEVTKIIVNPDDSIMIAGQFTLWHSSERYSFMARLHPNGTLDTSFKLDRLRRIGYSPSIRDFSKYSPGGWVIVGDFDHVNDEPRNAVAWINADGSLNTDIGNINSNASYMGKVYAPGYPRLIFLAGGFTQILGENRKHLAIMRPPIINILIDGFEGN